MATDGCLVLVVLDSKRWPVFCVYSNFGQAFLLILMSDPLKSVGS